MWTHPIIDRTDTVETPESAVVLMSGGMDSATLAFYLRALGTKFEALSFNYGQRHSRELEAVGRVLDDPALSEHCLGHEVVDLPMPRGSNALTGETDVPHGHYAEESMKQTVVPNRNVMFLSYAYAHAVAGGFDAVAAAVHAGDHFIYPDCRPGFVAAFTSMEEHALDDLGAPMLMTPFLHISKTGIAKIGRILHVPYKLTWTCYEGGDVHCGQCGACQERKEAFADSGDGSDPTEYAA